MYLAGASVVTEAEDSGFSEFMVNVLARVERQEEMRVSALTPCKGRISSSDTGEQWSGPEQPPCMAGEAMEF